MLATSLINDLASSGQSEPGMVKLDQSRPSQPTVKLNAAELIKIEQILQQAIAMHQAGNATEAQQLYLKVLQCLPLQATANHNLGILLLDAQQAAASLPYFRTALESEPGESQYWLSYIEALLQAHQYEDAQQVLSYAVDGGLQGGEINDYKERLANALGLKDTPIAAEGSSPQPVSQVVQPNKQSASNTQNKQDNKPSQIKAKKGNPGTADMNALINLFNEGDHEKSRQAALLFTQYYPKHGFGWKVLGALLQQQGMVAEALDALNNAVKLQPKDAEAFYNLGNCQYDLKQLQQAKSSYQKALKLHPRFAQAHYNLGSVFKDLKQYAEAEAAYKKALALGTGNIVMHLNLAEVLKLQQKWTEAEAAYLDALDINPDFFAAYFDLSMVYLQTGQTEKAVICLRKTIELKPDYVQAYFNLGIQMQAAGKRDEAIALYQQAISIDKKFAVAHNNLGQLYIESGERDQAIAYFRSAIEADTNFAAAYNNLGIALKDSGRFAEAKNALQRGLELNPQSAESLNNLAILVKEEGDYQHAETLYRQALSIAPNYLPALCNLAMALDSQERFDEAVGYLREAIALKPDFYEAYNNLGLIFKKQNRLTEAVACFEQAIQIKPDYKDVLSNLGSTLKDQGHMEQAQSYLRKALEIDPYYAYGFSNLLFNLNQSEHINAAELFAEHKLFGERFEGLVKPWQANTNKKDPDRTLRIGFVSADLRTHAVAFFIEPVLQFLAKSPALSLHAYANNVIYDQVSQRLHQYFEGWHQVSNLSDSELADKIRADGIDILVDLSGHTAGHRLLSFARKPAPIQASWLGYLGTTGLTAMDYYFTDKSWMPAGQLDDQFTEKLVQLPAYAPFQPEAVAPPVNALPALSNGYMTFGSFNRVSKLSKTVIALWADILRQLPDAKMLVGALAVDGDQETVSNWFAEAGISQERLIYHKRSSIAEYLALHQQVDICLDTFPHNGGTTTWHAVWMGVPTLTLAGNMPQSRISASILGQVKLSQFVVKEKKQFVQQALHWANNIAELAKIRMSMRQRFADSAAGQPAVIAQSLEDAFRIMWQRWCNGEAAAPFAVEAKKIGVMETSVLRKDKSQSSELQSSELQSSALQPSKVQINKPAQPSQRRHDPKTGQQALDTEVNTDHAHMDSSFRNAIEDVLQQAIECQNREEYLEAEHLYREILKVQPMHAAANHHLGVMEVHLKSVDEGLLRLEKALNAELANEQYWVSYIDALVMAGNIGAAVSAIESGQKFGLTAETAEMLAAGFVKEMESKLYSQSYEDMGQQLGSAAHYFNTTAFNPNTITPTINNKPVAKFLIVASSYTDKSGGIAMLHELCNSLNTLGYPAAIVMADNSKFTISDDASLYGPGLSWYALKSPQEYQHFIENGIVVYPEVITGNPLSARHVVRYMLNSEGYVTNNKMEASADDFILAFSNFYHDNPHAILTKLPLFSGFNEQNALPALDRNMDITYIGKGYSHNQCFIVPNSVEVTREWPKTKAELALLFKNARYFYTWDLRSQTNTDALLCGAIPVFLSPLPYASFDVLSEEELARQIQSVVTIDGEHVSVTLPDEFEKKAAHYKEGYLNAVNAYQNQCVVVVKQMLKYFSIPDIS